MATFSSKSFNSALYQSFRPGYNNHFFKMIYNYHRNHNGQFDIAVDVGTGTGKVAYELATTFARVKGLDASSTMLKNAVQKDNVTYHIAKSEDLSILESSSVDVLTVAQALHWFDHPQFFSEVKRVLKPRGTFAAIGYSFIIFQDHSRVTDRIFKLGNEPDQLGTFWDNGRLILDNLYKSVDIPMANVERHYFPNATLGQDQPLAMNDVVSMKHMRNYIKTWSSYKNYCEKYPTRPDIVDEAIDEILQMEGLAEEDEVNITWPTVVILGENSD
ncbi:hypothetical protein BGW38_003969 [Lunasporangiospora selenospora]|uniref:Methyltransferase type 11 domain-containing protein n=1 Tax=Lunasporangiospora selenospora TaxID=979761 RepID=A0A9P6FQP8_9FUNG|nr:hypothetical protein BGW38_003969 [Lunasporangiospora selenospora]